MSNKFFCFNGEYFDTYPTEEAARKAAKDALDQYRDDAMDDGWSDDTGKVCWGAICQTAEIIASTPLCDIEDCDGECGGDVHHSRDYADQVEYGLEDVK